MQLVVNQEGYVVVNDVQLDLPLPADPDARPLQIILCKEADREEMARRFYQLKSFEVVEETYQRRVKELEVTQPATATTVSKLQQERDQAKANAEKAADQGTRTGGSQGDDLLAQAVAAYRGALEVYSREQRPQDWATIQYDLGIALHAEGLRTGGIQGAERLAQAVAAFRSALEVITREQLPQDRAATQNDLGAALKEQALRAGGAQATDLLAQAVAAYRRALEVYTPEGFPAYHARVEANLARAEDLLEEATAPP